MEPIVETRDIKSIIPYVLNNKSHGEDAVARVASSIREFGWTFPLLVDEKNSLLAGHKRLLAAQKLGLSEVPVIVKRGLTEAQKKAYRIIDNKASEESDWNLQNLKLDVEALEDLGFELEPFILEDFEFETEDAKPVDDDAFVAPDRIDTKIKRGDIIELGPHKVICGDSSVQDDVNRLLDGRRPALMVTDPPYGVEYDPMWRQEWDGGLGKRATGKVTNDDIVDWGGG